LLPSLQTQGEVFACGIAQNTYHYRMFIVFFLFSVNHKNQAKFYREEPIWMPLCIFSIIIQVMFLFALADWGGVKEKNVCLQRMTTS